MPDSLTIDLGRLADVTNEAYWPLYTDTTNRFFALCGGAGSGKSRFVAQRLVVNHMVEQGHHTAIFRKVARTLRTSVFAEIGAAIEQLGVRDLWSRNKTELTWTFEPNGSIIRCFGLDDPEKIKSVFGITDMWVEEATEITRQDFMQLNLRLRGITEFTKRIWLTFNPISTRHWIKKEFFDTAYRLCRTLVTTYKDNRFLDEEYKLQLEGLAGKDSQLYRIYVMGMWGELVGVIFDWPVLPEPEYYDSEWYGLDFGFTKPTALVRVRQVGSRIHVHEMLYQTGMTTPDITNYMKSVGVHGRIVADSADPGRIKEIRKSGLNAVPCAKSLVKNDLMDMLGRYITTDETSRNLLDELSTYKWGMGADGVLTDVPVGLEDHAIDASRYAIMDGARRCNPTVSAI